MPTYTTIARLPIMQPGDPAVANSWGAIINGAWPCVEELAAGIGTIDLSGVTSYTLTLANDAADQARYAMLAFLGTPAGACTVALPPIPRIGYATNNTSQTLTLSAGGTQKQTLSPGATILYGCDGTNVFAYSLLPAGTLKVSGIQLPNNAYYQMLDSGGSAQNLLGLGSGNNTNLNILNANQSLRVVNAATSAVIASVTGAGAMVLSGSLSIATTLTCTGLVTAAAGMTTTGRDAGGLHARYTWGAYGAGWRNDGSSFYLLFTAAGNQNGSWSTLRPFYANLGTGAVTIDATGAGASFGGAVTINGALTAATLNLTSGSIGGVSFGGGAVSTSRVSTGTVTATGGLSGDSLTCNNAWVNATLNGNAAAFNSVSAGSATFTNLGVTNGTISNFWCTNIAASGGIAAAGNLSGGGVIATNATITAGLGCGTLTVSADATISGALHVNGGQNFAFNGGYVDPSGSHGAGSSSVTCSIIAANGIGAYGFYAQSDRRAKTEIADIDTPTAIRWIMQARPRTYQMDGLPQAGFVAQEDIAAGRGAAVSVLPDDRPQYADGDGYAPPGARLTRNYSHDIPYLTRALQDALARIATLEAKLKDA